MDGTAFKSLQASAEAVDMVIEEQDPGRRWDKRRFDHIDLNRHLLSKAWAS